LLVTKLVKALTECLIHKENFRKIFESKNRMPRY